MARMEVWFSETFAVKLIFNQKTKEVEVTLPLLPKFCFLANSFLFCLHLFLTHTCTIVFILNFSLRRHELMRSRLSMFKTIHFWAVSVSKTFSFLLWVDQYLFLKTILMWGGGGRVCFKKNVWCHYLVTDTHTHMCAHTHTCTAAFLLLLMLKRAGWVREGGLNHTLNIAETL